MKTDIGRADLLQYLAYAPIDDLALIADCFGYEYTPRTEPIVGPANISFEDKGDMVFVTVAEPPSQRPPEHFFRLTTITPSELAPAVAEDEEIRLPDWINNTDPLDLDADTRNKNAPPPPPPEPLVPWSRLWPVLRTLLSEQQSKKRPDLNRLVKIIASGQQARKIPLQQRQNWTAQCRILIDRPQRLRLFNHDYLQLINQFKKLRGCVGLIDEMIEDVPGGSVLTGLGLHTQSRSWHKPEPETPLLILSDLGIYEPSGQAQKQWLFFGRKLQAVGCKAYVLLPAPNRLLPQELCALYHCISWDRFSALSKATGVTAQALTKNQEHDREKLKALLPWLSPLLEMEPGLLRAIRQHLPRQPLDVSFEAQIWNHEDTVSNTTYASFSSEKVLNYRDSFMLQAAENKEQAQRLYDLLKRYHAHKFLLDYYEEVNLVAQAADCKEHEDEILREALSYLEQFVKATHIKEQHTGLAYHGQALLNRQPEHIKRRQACLSSLWGILQSRAAEGFERPDWINGAEAFPFLNHKQPKQHYSLVQQGEKLYLSGESSLQALYDSSLTLPKFRLAGFDTCSSLLVAEVIQDVQLIERLDYQLQHDRRIEWDLTQESRRLHVNGWCYALEAMTKPAWATAIGRDCYGLYAELNIKNVMQRFRWIEPGSFLMGSPEDEAGRYSDEDQHPVTLSQGFWLADTTVTQALWLAVMGKNPSQFKDDENNPVENVSWRDAQAFIERLNELFPGIKAKLPSEAQWEYACRAGTTTPFSFGANITPEQVNYDGEYPYADGKKGMTRGNTIAVKSLPANPWGLYEMHGNVWEWCSDYLGAEAASDPKGPESGAVRVVRGGSWNSGGRGVRSALRFRFGPDYRYYFLGFRLSLAGVESYDL